MEALTDVQLMEKHRTFRLNTGKKRQIAIRFSSGLRPGDISGKLVTE